MKQTTIEENAEAEALQLLTAEQAWHYGIVPVRKKGGVLTILYSEQADVPTFKEELELLTGMDIQLIETERSIVSRMIATHYRKQQSKGPTALLGNQDKNFLGILFSDATDTGASDIHIEPYEHHARVRFRIDGALIEKYRLEKDTYPGLVNQIKIKANLDISEKRLPQDGRIFMEATSGGIDIRVSSLPTLHGEKIVMRLLANHTESFVIEELGFEQEDLEKYLQGVAKQDGLVLISGPTGSGKTTTLYATLKMLNDTKRNIVTIEDPIEYTIQGINQVQLKESIGLDFASALRTFLRQDPDVIMVGEIRDLDTAAMAIRASLTGHLVLSTIHTNSAWGIVARLLDMGVPAYMLADTLNAAIAQRLVRLLCPVCKKAAPFDDSLLNGKKCDSNLKPELHYTAVGCEHCFFTGYRGRKAIYEVITIDKELSKLIREQRLDTTSVLSDKKIRLLADSAFLLMANGETSVSEIIPILN